MNGEIKNGLGPEPESDFDACCMHHDICLVLADEQFGKCQSREKAAAYGAASDVITGVVGLGADTIDFTVDAIGSGLKNAWDSNEPGVILKW